MRIVISILFVLFSIFGITQTVNDLRPTVTMKEYVDMQAQLNRDLAKVQFENIEKNVAKANDANEKRLDSVNEFRGQLRDQASTFVTWTALLTTIFGVSGFLFGYANYMKGKREREDKERDRNASGKSIMSGDKVEVKK